MPSVGWATRARLVPYLAADPCRASFSWGGLASFAIPASYPPRLYSYCFGDSRTLRTVEGGCLREDSSTARR